MKFFNENEWMYLLTDHKGIRKANRRKNGTYLHEEQSMNEYKLTFYTCNVVEFEWGGDKSGIA